MAARYLLNNSTSENGKSCQLQQNHQHQENIYQHRCHVHTHLGQPSANTHRTHCSSTTLEGGIKRDTTCASPPPPAPEGGPAALSVVMPTLPSHPSANTHQTQFSISMLKGCTTFSAPQEAAALPSVLLPPPSLSPVAMPDRWSVHMYNDHFQQQTCLNGEEHEPIVYHGLLPSQPLQSYSAAMASATYTAVPVPMATSRHHQLQLCRHEPLYGCGCVDCVAVFSSPGHGYLSPLTHFSDDKASCPPRSHVGEATPACYSHYSSSFPAPQAAVVSRLDLAALL